MNDRTVPGESHWYGAAHIDGVRGKELVLHTSAGAHTVQDRVITYRDGRLTSLRDPHGSIRWTTDQSATSIVGYERQGLSNGRVKLTHYTGHAPRQGGDFRETVTTSVWSEGAWKQVDQTTRAVVPNKAFADSGWNVRGLPEHG
ncbi:hypothetical protein [Kytococcus sp. Marseille-QA3725]